MRMLHEVFTANILHTHRACAYKTTKEHNYLRSECLSYAKEWKTKEPSLGASVYK